MGCSGYYCTSAAGVLGIFESLGGLCWNIWLLHVFQRIEDEEPNTENGHGRNSLIEHFKSMPDQYNVYILVVVSTIYHAMLLLSSIGLLVGNKIHSRYLIAQWIPVVIIIVLSDILAGIYFTLQLGVALMKESLTENPVPVLLAVLFSRGCLLFVFINVFLVYFVCERFLEIATREYCHRRAFEHFEGTPISDRYPQVIRQYMTEEHLVTIKQPVYVEERKPEEEEETAV